MKNVDFYTDPQFNYIKSSNSDCIVIATVSDGGYYNTMEQLMSSGFDLAQIQFNPEQDLELSGASYSLCEKGFKHRLVKKLLETTNILYKYKWIWIPDYDINPNGCDNISKLFEYAKSYNLNICQPSLTPDSYRSFEIVVNNPGKVLRYTNYVEVMCPLFGADVLKSLLWSFDLTYSGWAQDILWARSLNYEKLAIVDAVKMTHTKEINSQNWVLPNGLNADKELEMVLNLYGLQKDDWWPKVLGDINENGL